MLNASGLAWGVPPGSDDELVVVVFVVPALEAVLPSGGVGTVGVEVVVVAGGAPGGTVMPGMPILCQQTHSVTSDVYSPQNVY